MSASGTDADVRAPPPQTTPNPRCARGANPQPGRCDDALLGRRRGGAWRGRGEAGQGGGGAGRGAALPSPRKVESPPSGRELRVGGSGP